MALVHLNQLRPTQAPHKPVEEALPAPLSPVAHSPGKAPSPPPLESASTPPATWGAFSQRLLDKLDAVERTATALQGGTPALRPDRT